MVVYYFTTEKEENGMMTIEGLTKYLDETGLGKRIENLKPGDEFGVEVPIDEENDKNLRFWLSAEGSEKVEFITLDFEGMIRARVCLDEKMFEEWLERSGILELAKLFDRLETEEKKE